MNLSRRDFIKGFGAFVAGLGLGAAKAEAKEVEVLPVPDATVELSTGYEVPIYELEPIESECLKWEQIGRDMLDGYMEGLRDFWPMDEIGHICGPVREIEPEPVECDDKGWPKGTRFVVENATPSQTVQVEIGPDGWIIPNDPTKPGPQVCELCTDVCRSPCPVMERIGGIEVEAERLKLETLERCTPPDDLVRYPNGKIDVIGTIRAQIDRARR